MVESKTTAVAVYVGRDNYIQTVQCTLSNNLHILRETLNFEFRYYFTKKGLEEITK
jgi:hypothetical protein